MSPEVRARIFEPFFTTKGVGEGTGLGLATVHGIVVQTGGRIEVESNLGGTSFHVYFPATQRVPALAPPTASVPAPAPSAALRVLVVDDEEMVRRVVVRALLAAGHTVEDATTAQAALDLLASGRDYDLIVSDVVMPVIGGLELARRVRAQRPEARFLFVSGYSDTPGVDEAAGRTGLLSKPFTPAQLYASIAKLVERPAPPLSAKPAHADAEAAAGVAEVARGAGVVRA
jgi:CheY-like chemotaxis protein